MQENEIEKIGPHIYMAILENRMSNGARIAHGGFRNKYLDKKKNRIE